MTLGLVSILLNGLTQLKIATVYDGYFAWYIAEHIRQLGSIPTDEEAYWIARAYHFGTRDDIIVVSSNTTIYRGRVPLEGCNGDISARCRLTFEAADANPWEDPKYPQSAYVEAVEFESCKEPKIRTLKREGSRDIKPHVREITPGIKDALQRFEEHCRTANFIPENERPTMGSANFAAEMAVLTAEILAIRQYAQAILAACTSRGQAEFATEELVWLTETELGKKTTVLQSVSGIAAALYDRYK